jgi:hypothetical protein
MKSQYGTGTTKNRSRATTAENDVQLRASRLRKAGSILGIHTGSPATPTDDSGRREQMVKQGKLICLSRKREKYKPASAKKVYRVENLKGVGEKQ